MNNNGFIPPKPIINIDEENKVQQGNNSESISSKFSKELDNFSQAGARVYIDGINDKAKVVFNKDNNLEEETAQELEEQIRRIRAYYASKGVDKGELIVETRLGRYYSSSKGFLED